MTPTSLRYVGAGSTHITPNLRTVNEGKILMIDDDEDVLLAAKMLLKKYNYQVIIEKNPNKIPFLLNNDTYDVILLDMNFQQGHHQR